MVGSAGVGVLDGVNCRDRRDIYIVTQGFIPGIGWITIQKVPLGTTDLQTRAQIMSTSVALLQLLKKIPLIIFDPKFFQHVDIFLTET